MQQLRRVAGNGRCQAGDGATATERRAAAARSPRRACSSRSSSAVSSSAATSSSSRPGRPSSTSRRAVECRALPPSQQQQEAFPPYSVLRRGDGYDLRLYAPYAVVETDYTRRDAGFEALGAYKDGANADGARFGVTQPVLMAHHPGGRKVMQLMVGARRGTAGGQLPSVAELPAPTDAAVRLGVAGGECVAVMPFSGSLTPEAAAAARRRLADALAADGLALAEDEAAGLYRVGQYGQIYTLAQRLNEVMLAVQI